MGVGSWAEVAIVTRVLKSLVLAHLSIPVILVSCFVTGVNGLVVTLLNVRKLFVSSLMTDGLVSQGRLEVNRVLVVVNVCLVDNDGWVVNGSLMVHHWLVVHNCFVMHDWHDVVDDSLSNLVDINVSASVLVDKGCVVVDGLAIV